MAVGGSRSVPRQVHGFSYRLVPRFHSYTPLACRFSTRAATSSAIALNPQRSQGWQHCLKPQTTTASFDKGTLNQARLYSGCGCAGASRTKKAYIALGSNLGDRVAEIENACNEMDKRGIRVKRTSSLWETEPMYVTDQDRFVNGACEV